MIVRQPMPLSALHTSWPWYQTRSSCRVLGLVFPRYCRFSELEIPAFILLVWCNIFWKRKFNCSENLNSLWSKLIKVLNLKFFPFLCHRDCVIVCLKLYFLEGYLRWTLAMFIEMYGNFCWMEISLLK